MPISTLTRPLQSAVLALGLIAAPAWAQAERPTTHLAANAAQVVESSVDTLVVPTPEELEDLASRDAAADLEDFEGGEVVIVVSTSLLTVAVLLVLLLLILD